MKQILLGLLLITLLVNGQTTDFTYQGRLTDGRALCFGLESLADGGSRWP